MTPAQALAVMELLRPRIGPNVVGVNGLEGDMGQVVLIGPAGFLSVAIPLPHPLPLTRAELVQLLASAESRIRALMSVYETDAGRGFSPRGVQKPGEPGFSAGDGYV